MCECWTSIILMIVKDCDDDDENNIGKDNDGDDGQDYGDVTGHRVGASRAPEGCMALMIFALHLITRTVSSPLPETTNITQICY